MAEHRGEVAFTLLLDAARLAESGGDPRTRAIALAHAVTIANRATAEFTDEIPHARLRALLETARAIAPTGDVTVAAYLAVAEAWNATGHKTNPDPELSEIALKAARDAGDVIQICGVLDAVVAVASDAGRYRDAHRGTQERLALLDRLPWHDPRAGVEILDVQFMAARDVCAGDLPGALAAARRTPDATMLRGVPHFQHCRPIVALVLSGRFDEALTEAETMWAHWESAGRPAAGWMAAAVYAVAMVHGLRGDSGGYRRWTERAEAVSGPVGTLTGPLGAVSNAAVFGAFTHTRISLHAGRIDEALRTAVDLSAMPPWYEATHTFYDAYAWAVAAETAVLAGLPDAAERLAIARPAAAENDWAAACLARAHGRLHNDPDALRESIIRWETIGARFERAATLALLKDLS